ncbi:MAG: hypothetical protein JOZ01_06060 [Candidatus Eremiobacteraeota bacterium]|nr:hypothetical protein [Candidatus Eremiobacteraeota bacterium]
MEPAAGASSFNVRVIWIVAVGTAIIIVAFVAAVVALVFAFLGMMGRTDAHVCGLAAVRRSPAAVALVGTPIVQQGFTAGSTSSSNGELSERMTFTVKGPSGTAFVVAEGRRSPLASQLNVVIGRDQHSQTVYSGPFDCPELHRLKP